MSDQRRPMKRQNKILVTKNQANAMRGLFTPPHSSLPPAKSEARQSVARDARFWIATKYFGRKITNFDDFTLNEWRSVLRFAYEDWQSGDWTKTKSWTAAIRLWTAEYVHEVLGQIPMFE